MNELTETQKRLVDFVNERVAASGEINHSVVASYNLMPEVLEVGNTTIRATRIELTRDRSHGINFVDDWLSVLGISYIPNIPNYPFRQGPDREFVGGSGDEALVIEANFVDTLLDRLEEAEQAGDITPVD